jgi:glutaminyl-tRNA synthetase
MYRIRRQHHHRTGDQWVIYPTYDWAHGQSDAIEGVTHSLCTLEFDSHRPLYDWYLEHLPLPGYQPRQTEFARLELTHTVTSKRRLATLVADGVVDGWDDPRLPTLRGLRRRGYPAAAIREFCSYIGVSRTNSRHQIELLESFVRADLNRTALRRMAVLRPLRVDITNWPTDHVEHVELGNNPENAGDGTRLVPLSGTLYIERDDFMVEPAPKYFRLSPGKEVRLRGAYFLQCTGYTLGDARFLLQDFFVPDHAGNFVMALNLPDLDAFWQQVQARGLAQRYGVAIDGPQRRPWGRVDMTVIDPSGVLWRIAQRMEVA